MPALLTDVEDGILIVTINRPEKKNAANAEVLCGFVDAWRRLDADDELRCCILTGAGDNFCAGMDLGVISRMGSGEGPADEFERRMMEQPETALHGWLKTYRPTKPIIAAVEGYALAGGTEILQGTDIRVAGKSAKFGITEVQRGLFPMAGSSVRLPRQIPYTIAVEMLVVGDPISAKQAKKVGLIGHVTKDGKALDKALELGGKIASNGPVAVKGILKSIRETYGLPEGRAFEIEMPIGQSVFASEDAKEGPRAFLEKRKPHWKGR
jgi:enoyl-CoA hydratase